MVNVIGLGYIGLPTALMLAANNIKVVGTDINQKLIDTLNSGKVTFEEKGLSDLFEKAKENITFTTEYQKTDLYILAVPTPYDKLSKKIDPSYVQEAFIKAQEVAEDDAIIIIESTVSPGTIDKHIRPLINKKVNIVHAPERIIPGNMIYELENNSRTIGADNKEIGEMVKGLYSSFCKGNIVITDIRSAEMSKVVENTYRDINIAFANELAKICREGSLNVYEIIKLANMHPRVNILKPGPGVGGHCISVDPWFLVGDYPGLANIILAARRINDSMPKYVLNRTYEIMQEKGIKDTSRVGLYGLTYKENVDDIRDSPTLQLLDLMKRHLAPPLKVYDPWIKEKLFDSQYFDFDEFLENIDLLVIMVAHKHLLANTDKIKDKIIYDTKNIIDLENVYKL
ncbi:MAG TPA: nucleotide sugar dehydrogenase [Acholeplasmataceae bacterium]|nr:nucleotide sugar dehydrogenase [Acholeplasmataceae bacterium]